MSKPEHAGPHKRGRREEDGWWASDIITTLGVRVCVCVRTRACVRVCLICFPEQRRQKGLWDASQHTKGECMYTSADECSPWCFQAPRMTFSLFFFPFLPLSGRSWEELNGLSHRNLKAKVRQDATSSWTLAIRHFTFTVSVALLLPLSWKNSLQLPSFYNLGESLTTAISHDKVFN